MLLTKTMLQQLIRIAFRNGVRPMLPAGDPWRLQGNLQGIFCDQLIATGLDASFCDLAGSSWVEASLEGTNFFGASLASADLSQANCAGANLTACIADGLVCVATD